MKQLSQKYINQSLSHATMKPEDLIPEFMSFLESVSTSCDIKSEIGAIVEDVEKLTIAEPDGYGEYYTDDCQEAASYILNEDIWNLLDSIAPIGAAGFGAHPGDGSDFGFWQLSSEDIVGNIWLKDTSGKHVIIYCEIVGGIPEDDIIPDKFKGELYAKLKNTDGAKIVKMGFGMEYELDTEDIFSGLYGDIVSSPIA